MDNFIYTKPSTPRRGAATIGRIDTIYGTWNAERGTRYSMPPKGAATLCHIDTRYRPPEGGATYCHILDVVCFTVTEPLPMAPRRGATI